MIYFLFLQTVILFQNNNCDLHKQVHPTYFLVNSLDNVNSKEIKFEGDEKGFKSITVKSSAFVDIQYARAWHSASSILVWTAEQDTIQIVIRNLTSSNEPAINTTYSFFSKNLTNERERIHEIGDMSAFISFLEKEQPENLGYAVGEFLSSKQLKPIPGFPLASRWHHNRRVLYQYSQVPPKTDRNTIFSSLKEGILLKDSLLVFHKIDDLKEQEQLIRKIEEWGAKTRYNLLKSIVNSSEKDTHLREGSFLDFNIDQIYDSLRSSKDELPRLVFLLVAHQNHTINKQHKDFFEDIEVIKDFKNLLLTFPGAIHFDTSFFEYLKRTGRDDEMWDEIEQTVLSVTESVSLKSTMAKKEMQLSIQNSNWIDAEEYLLMTLCNIRGESFKNYMLKSEGFNIPIENKPIVLNWTQLKEFRALQQFFMNRNEGIVNIVENVPREINDDHFYLIRNIPYNNVNPNIFKVDSVFDELPKKLGFYTMGMSAIAKKLDLNNIEINVVTNEICH